jgi:hypothetical protein
VDNGDAFSQPGNEVKDKLQAFADARSDIITFTAVAIVETKIYTLPTADSMMLRGTVYSQLRRSHLRVTHMDSIHKSLLAPRGYDHLISKTIMHRSIVYVREGNLYRDFYLMFSSVNPDSLTELSPDANSDGLEQMQEPFQRIPR